MKISKIGKKKPTLNFSDKLFFVNKHRYDS